MCKKPSKSHQNLFWGSQGALGAHTTENFCLLGPVSTYWVEISNIQYKKNRFEPFFNFSIFTQLAISPSRARVWAIT